MNLVKSEKLEKNQHELQFSIDAASFNDAIAKAYKREAGKYNIPGFRKGKAPRHMIEKMYGEDVFQYSAVNDLFPAEYDKAVEASGIEPVDRPEVDIVSMNTEDGVVLKAVVTVKPEMKVGNYIGLKAEKAANTVEDAAVDAEVNRLRERNARLVAREGKAQDGDITDIDFEGFVDGEAFDGGKGEHFSLTLGSGQFIPGFEEQMVGMNIGEEKDLNVTFPEKYHSEELAGKNAVFHVKVLSATRTELPKLDDDFAADASEYNTFAEYKDSIVKELNDRAAKNNEIAVENALVEKAVENASMDIPQAMINEQTNYLLREMQMRMAYQGLKMEDYLKYTGQTIEQLADMYKGEAEHRVKVELTLDAIRKAEGIEPTDEDVAKQIAEQAERMGQSVEDFEKTLTDEQRGYLRDTAAIQKVVDLMKQDCTVEEKKEEAAEEKAADAE